MTTEPMLIPRARCASYFAELAALRYQRHTPDVLAGMIRELTSAILAEASSLTRPLMETNQLNGPGLILASRMTRLRAAADDAVSAAASSDQAALVRNLRTFEALSRALMAVRESVTVPSSAREKDANRTAGGTVRGAPSR